MDREDQQSRTTGKLIRHESNLTTKLNVQLVELNEKYKVECDLTVRLKKQTQDLQKNYSALEFEYNESNNQYEELSQIKEKLEKDNTNQQTLFEQEKNAKSLIW